MLMLLFDGIKERGIMRGKSEVDGCWIELKHNEAAVGLFDYLCGDEC